MGVFCYVLQQPSTAGLAKTKADIGKKRSHSYSSHWFYPSLYVHVLFELPLMLITLTFLLKFIEGNFFIVRYTYAATYIIAISCQVTHTKARSTGSIENY